MWRFDFYNTHIDFLRWAKLAMGWSIAVLLIAVGSLLIRGMNLGLDFTGGTVIEVQYPNPADPTQIRATLAKAGFGDAQAQHFGTARAVLIRIPPHAQTNAATLSNDVLHTLQGVEGGADVTLVRAEFVGPQVGQELVEQGGLAALGALLGILVYVMFRFEWRLAVGTVAATVHDVIFTIGWFSLFQIEFDLTVLAAVLAVIGYSVNDTVVVLDRIRDTHRSTSPAPPRCTWASVVKTCCRGPKRPQMSGPEMKQGGFWPPLSLWPHAARLKDRCATG